jgi:Na+/H+ antiporter NhaA
MRQKIIMYFKSLNWKFLLIASLFCIVLAILNNIRVDASKSVEWVGTQKIFEKPE